MARMMATLSYESAFAAEQGGVEAQVTWTDSERFVANAIRAMALGSILTAKRNIAAGPMEMVLLGSGPSQKATVS